MSAPVQLSWGSTDIRYNKFNIPDIKKKAQLSLTAWKGELHSCSGCTLD